jgi:histidine ammonia-lyase
LVSEGNESKRERGVAASRAQVDAPLVLPGPWLDDRVVVEVAHGRRALTSGLRADPTLRQAWSARRQALLDRLAMSDVSGAGAAGVYGVSTGFGASCTNPVDAASAAALASNLYAYHGCGVGPAFSEREGRAILVVRLAQLASGHSALSPATFDALVALLEAGVVPVIPELGSVGASGDLTPLSYVAAVLSGEREAYFEGEVMAAREALRRGGLMPHVLGPKESLSIMNGTSVMTALTALALRRIEVFVSLHAIATALAVVAVDGRRDHFDARIFAAKPHPGSVRYAAVVYALLEGHAGAREGGGVQDPYSLRCAPHVVGVLIDAQRHAREVLEIELNGASDNPLVSVDGGEVLHGGNFYGGHIAYIADALKAQVASAAEVLERQLPLMTQPARSRGLPENLVLAGDVARHGFKAMEILSSSLVAEALKATMPAGSFSRSTEGHNQDKVSMGTIAARDLRRVLDLAEYVLAVSLLAGAQAVDARGAHGQLSPTVRRAHALIRELSPVVTDDRRLDLDLGRVRASLADGALAELGLLVASG